MRKQRSRIRISPGRDRLLFVLLAGAMALTIVGGCSGESDSPEQQIKTLIARAESAAESKDINALGELVGDNYMDEHDNDRRRILQILRIQFLRHQNVHLLVQIKSVDVLTNDSAEAVLVVALGGKNVPDADALVDINVDLYRFEIEFTAKRSGDWKVSQVKWNRASLAEFL